VSIITFYVLPASYQHWAIKDFNLVMFLLTQYLNSRYGVGDFSHVESRGQFAVGFKEIYVPGEENAVSVFYPMDKERRNNTLNKWWLHYRMYDAFLAGMSRSRKWRQNSKSSAPLQQMYSWRNVEFDAEPDGRLADVFYKGEKKLIPIVFSHGLTASRVLYQVTARELASHGYIIFLIDHHDGTCTYTENKRGDKKFYFDSDTPFWQYEDMHAKTLIREKEASGLIDFICT
jgi:hypothetical protein